MKKQLKLLLLFAIISFNGWTQSISFTSYPSTTTIGTVLTVNYKYTNATAGQVSCGISLLNDWTYISFVGGGYLNPAVAGTDVTGTFNILIPSVTTPTANLTGLQNYKINIELKNASGGWLAGDYPATPLNFTTGTAPAISITSLPTSTQAGTDLVVNYKYTAASSGKTSIAVTKNGGTNPWDYISTVGFIELNPAVAGTDVAGTFTVAIPSGTTPTSALTGNENYRITLELKNSSDVWLAGDYSTINYNITPVAVTPAISITSLPTSTQAGTDLVVNYKYTAASSGKTSIAVTKNGGTNPSDYISTVGYIELDPAIAGTDVTGTFTVAIPSGTTPTSALTGNENYRITLELKNSSNVWLAGDYSTINYNITPVAVTPAISITTLPTSTQVGTDLVVNYKYTAASSGKTSVVVTKNGGTNPWDYISTVGFIELDPAVAGTDVTGTFTVPISAGTTPTSALIGNENYRITLELKNSSNVWLAGDNSALNYNFTSAATTWTGGTSTTWTDASNWSNGVPDATKDVTIGTGTFQPVIGSNVDINTLTINEFASVMVNSGFNLTVTDVITNNGGTLTIANNANLIQENDVFNTGSVTVNRNGNSLTRNEYTIWSSPVSTQNLLAFSPNTLPTRFYNYNQTNNKFSVVAGVASVPFTVGSGYLIRMPDNWVGTQAYAGSFSGIPNNGNISKAVDYSGATFGYNMVGNPYPSTIDANAFITANSANIESSLYFWRKINGALTAAYAVFNPMGSTTATPSSDLPNGKIQVGQGFIVKAKSGATAISFTNAMRVANTEGQFFKTKAVQKDRLWLNLTNATGVFSQALIGYTAAATAGVDIYDAKYFKDITDSSTALTSSINNEEYSIQGRPAFDATDVVALNFKTDFAGDYSIALDHFDGVFSAGQDVYLVDSKSGIETNLKENAYTFNAAVGTDNARFSLKFQKTLKVIGASIDQNIVNVYQSNGAIYINSKATAISSIKVFDVQGRLLAEQRNVKANTAVISNLKAKNQILIVNVVGEDNSEVSKKIMN